jgi:hypothetical protein
MRIAKPPAPSLSFMDDSVAAHRRRADSMLARAAMSA